MISYLKGFLTNITPQSPSGTYIILDVNGVGYKILVNERTISLLPEINAEVQIFTTLIHKEDSMILAGFFKAEERELFEILLGVSGVGLKMALALLNEISAIELIQAVLAENTKKLSKTKGVGQKLAQKLILELKDKMKLWQGTREQKAPAKTLNTAGYQEAQSVLLAIGYTKEETEKGLGVAVSQLGEKANSEELLKVALETISF